MSQTASQQVATGGAWAKPARGIHTPAKLSAKFVDRSDPG